LESSIRRLGSISRNVVVRSSNLLFPTIKAYKALQPTSRIESMVFKKGDPKTIEAAIKANRNPKGVSSPEWRKKNPEKWQRMLEQRAIYGSAHLKKLHKDPAFKRHQSEAGKKSRYYENNGAETLKKYFDKIFKPSDVCDRICFDTVGIAFVEIKQTGQKLRPKQEEFKVLCENRGLRYEILYVR
jgi:hypothetical protein